MAWVVFFRAVNVGGHQTFQPGALARKLTRFGVTNLGAAGTFVVRENVSEAALRGEILRHLPFTPELMICPAEEVLALAARGGPFRDLADAGDAGRLVSVLREVPAPLSRLPLAHPAGDRWEVRIIGLVGRFVLSLRRPGRTYSNVVVERQFGVPATTRTWKNMEAVRNTLQPEPAHSRGTGRRRDGDRRR